MGIWRKDYNVLKPSQGCLENITGKTKKQKKRKADVVWADAQILVFFFFFSDQKVDNKAYKLIMLNWNLRDENQIYFLFLNGQIQPGRKLTK